MKLILNLVSWFNEIVANQLTQFIQFIYLGFYDRDPTSKANWKRNYIGRRESNLFNNQNNLLNLEKTSKSSLSNSNHKNATHFNKLDCAAQNNSLMNYVTMYTLNRKNYIMAFEIFLKYVKSLNNNLILIITFSIILFCSNLIILYNWFDCFKWK